MSKRSFNIIYRGITMQRHLYNAASRNSVFTLAFDYAYFDWQNDNGFIGFYNQFGELLTINHTGDNTFRKLNLSETCEEAWSDIEKKFIEANTYERNKSMIRFLRPFLTADFHHPNLLVTDVVHRENDRYLDIYFSFNDIMPISFCYLISKDSPQFTRICKLIINRGKNDEIACQTHKFFGDDEDRIITKLMNHPKVRLKALL